MQLQNPALQPKKMYVKKLPQRGRERLVDANVMYEMNEK